MEDKVKKLQKLLEVLNESLTRKEFTTSFERVLKLVVEIEKKTSEAIAQMDATFKAVLAKIGEDYNIKVEDIKKTADKIIQGKDGYNPQRGVDYLTDLELEQIKNEILEKATPKKGEHYVDGINGSPDTSDEIINKISGLIEIKDIKGLKEILDELDKRKNKLTLGGGGFNYGSLDIHIIDDETPTGTINDVNTIFNIAHTPSPQSSLKVYLNGARQRLTTDYTLSGKTITFNVAPPTGSILLVDYRK